LSIGFLCENRTIQFSKPDDSIFLENSYIHLFDLISYPFLSYIASLSPKLSFHSLLAGAACQAMRKRRGSR
jgi:hypothetical protein